MATTRLQRPGKLTSSSESQSNDTQRYDSDGAEALPQACMRYQRRRGVITTWFGIRYRCNSSQSWVFDLSHAGLVVGDR